MHYKAFLYIEKIVNHFLNFLNPQKKFQFYKILEFFVFCTDSFLFKACIYNEF